MSEKTLTPNEVMAILNLSASTLAQWRSARKNLAFYKVGKRVTYKLSDVEEYLKGYKVGTKDE